jgi:endonuclease/exonuclease/phosphatase family metal-dependent hydrolase
MSPKFKKIARISFISLNCITIFFYLLACLVPFLNPGVHWFIALLGLVFPLLFFVLLGFLIYWVLRRSKWAFICVAVLLISWQQVTVVFNLFGNKKFNTVKSPESLRILTWNLSSWGESNRSDTKNNMDDMVGVIKTANADVLCFQEYLYFKRSKFRDSIIPALRAQGYRYAYFGQIDYTGYLYSLTVLTATVIMSKYPFIDSSKTFYREKEHSEPLLSIDLKFHDQTVRIFNTHLQSVSFQKNDYAALHSLKEPGEASVAESRAMVGKIKIGYKKRAGETDILQTKIKESPHPVIVCGDFNDVPNSYTYFTVKGNLQDAFLEKGWGLGRTFRFISPTLRIDYILADKRFNVKQYTELKFPYSDHYAVVADIDISNNK